MIRGLIGILVLGGIPTLQDIIETTPLEDKVMRMAEITAIFTDHLKSKGLEYMEKNRFRLTLYGTLTVICLMADLALLICTCWNLGVNALVFY